MHKNRQEIVISFLDSYKQMHMLFWKALAQATAQVGDVSPGLFAVLKCLTDPEGMSQSQIAGQLRQSDAAVSRKISQLQKQGLIEVRTVENNRRKVQVTLTDKGERLHKEVHGRVITLLGELLSDVSDDMLIAITSNNTYLETKVRKSLEGIKEGEKEEKNGR